MGLFNTVNFGTKLVNAGVRSGFVDVTFGSEFTMNERVRNHVADSVTGKQNAVSHDIEHQ